MNGFIPELRQGLQRCRLNKAQVLIAVSGGADSIALLRGMLELRYEFELVLHVAHLNHQLRGQASDDDAAWVAQLSRTLQVPVTIGIGGLDRSSTGIEEAARAARHRFLDETASATGCSFILTAHTADDQAETVLHHIFRGTGLSGLRGIPETRKTVVSQTLARPMLKIRRKTVESYLAELNQDFRTDATNSDTLLTRNWLRHKLLPELHEQFGSRLNQSLIQLAEQAAEIERTLTILAERLLDQIVLDAQPGAVRLDVRPLADQPVHLVREAFCVLWDRQRWSRQAMGFNEWSRLAVVALMGGDANLPGNIRARQHPPGLLVVEKTNRQSVLRS